METTHAIEAIDVRAMSDAELADLNTLRNTLRAESRPGDPPVPLAMTQASFRNIPEIDEVRLWFVRDGDALIASAQCTWEPAAKNNRHVLDSHIEVLADARGIGVGRALLAEVVALADAESRTLLIGGTDERVASGGAFAQRIGAAAGQVNRISRLLLDEVDRAMLDRWIEEGPVRARGYTLEFIDGDIPDELVDDAIDAFHVMNTAPRDDLDIEDWELTPEHMRSWEKQMRAAGGERFTLFVRHDASGKVIGFTELSWNENIPGIVQQMGTAVHPDHRGHALGKWLKADMLRRVIDGRFAAREIRTGNAESNDAMLGINVALGFEPWLAHTAWQLKTDAAHSYLAARG